MKHYFVFVMIIFMSMIKRYVKMHHFRFIMNIYGIVSKMHYMMHHRRLSITDSYSHEMYGVLRFIIYSLA